MVDNLEKFSWDKERPNAPERPEIAVTVTDDELIERPKTVWLAFTFISVSTIIFAFITVLAIINFEELKATILAALPEDLEEEYSTEDITKAAGVLLWAVIGASSLMGMIIFLAGISVTFTRNIAARVLMLVTIFIFLPAAFVFYTMRDAGTQDLVLNIASVVFLFLSVGLFFTPLISRWLRQPEKPKQKNLITKPELDENV